MDVVRGRIGPATNVRTLNLRLNFMMSFLPVLLYFKSSWSFKPRQCKKYSTFSGSGGPGFGSFHESFLFPQIYWVKKHLVQARTVVPTLKVA